MAQTVTLGLADVQALARRIFASLGFGAVDAGILADTIMRAERDGPRSHGLFMLPAYASSVRSGWADPRGVPNLERPRPGRLDVDGGNNFAQISMARYRDDLIAAARELGVATLSIRNSHHIAALRGDIEPIAAQGLIALMFVASRLWLAPWRGRRRVFGTNPMAFACPRPDGPPIVWDMASSAVALTDLRLAASQGHAAPADAILDAQGNPTTDPRAIESGGMLLPFGGHKGMAVALMVEILAAALTGGNLALEDQSAKTPGAMSARGGQLMLVLDPAGAGGASFGRRVAMLIGAIEGNGEARVPGDGRLARRAAAERDGVTVDAALLDRLNKLG